MRVSGTRTFHTVFNFAVIGAPDGVAVQSDLGEMSNPFRRPPDFLHQLCWGRAAVPDVDGFKPSHDASGNAKVVPHQETQ